MIPRRFRLRRMHDVSGVSGVGVVAYGVQFGDGTCVLRWVSGTACTSVWDCLSDLEAVHGHGGSTVAEFIDAAPLTVTKAQLARVDIEEAS